MTCSGAEPRASSCSRRLEGVDRLVLLGDLLELRHGPAREALAVARPVLARHTRRRSRPDAGRVVPGNHDHALIDPWLVGRGRRGPPSRWGSPRRCRRARRRRGRRSIERAMGAGERRVSYPGRAGCATTCGRPTATTSTSTRRCRRSSGSPPVPCRGSWARCRSRGPRRTTTRGVLAPVYAWIDARAERAAPGSCRGGLRERRAAPTGCSAAGGRRPMAARAVAGLFPLAILGINRPRPRPGELRPARPGAASLRRCAGSARR